MEASEELATSSLNALLSDPEAEESPKGSKDRVPEQPAGETAEDATSSQQDLETSREQPLKSPFEEFAPPRIPTSKPPIAQSMSQRVRFNGGLESFSEEPEGLPCPLLFLYEQKRVTCCAL